VASDGILRQEGRELLSPVQVRSMLEQVARAHLAKLDRLAALESAGGIAADDGRARDRVMGWTRRLQASRGIAAVVGESERRILARTISLRSWCEVTAAGRCNHDAPS
jgi:hypothetical protein